MNLGDDFNTPRNLFGGGPPRSVPLSVQLRQWFGGFSNQFGWAFFGFGSAFVMVFVAQSNLLTSWRFVGELDNVEGVVVESRRTTATSGSSRRGKKQPIFANVYRFQHADQSYEGTSYATGRQLQTGNSVTIEFPVGQPEYSRIRGMRTATFGPAVLLTLIFPCVGLGFLIAGLRSGWRATYLLRNGERAEANLRRKEATSTRVNRRTVYKLTFEFVDQSGTVHEAVARTHRPEKLEDDFAEPLLYDPARPACNTLLDHLPGSPSLDGMGEVTLDRPGMTPLVLVLPTIAVVVIGLLVANHLSG